MDKIVKALSNPTITLGMPSRPNNVNLRLLGGKLEVERVHHHSDMRFRLKKGLAGTGVASGAEQPRRPTVTLVKGHYEDAPPPFYDEDFEDIDELRRNLRQMGHDIGNQNPLPVESHYATLTPTHNIYEELPPLPNEDPLPININDIPLSPLPYEEVAPRRNARRRARQKNRQKNRRNCSIQ